MSDDEGGADWRQQEECEEREFHETLADKYPSMRATWPQRKDDMSDTEKTDLLKINVNEHTEKKGQLTYLSWAWAWAEVLKLDPAATWEAVEYPNPDGTKGPCMWIGDTAMVKTAVTVFGRTKTCQLAVMDNRNNAVKNPDARKISDAIMRCMTKAIGMHGLGLYIYAGEDLPEGEPPEGDKKPEIVPASGFRSSPTMGELEGLPEDQREHIRDLALEVIAAFKGDQDDRQAAVAMVEAQALDDSQKMALWGLLDAPTRSAFKKIQATKREKAPA